MIQLEKNELDFVELSDPFALEQVVGMQ